MDAAVVELDALTDSIRAAAEDDDAGPVGGAHFVLVLVGRVVVRRLGGELCRACVDGLIRGNDAGCFADLSYVQLVGVPQMGELAIAEPHLLGSFPLARCQFVGLGVREGSTFLDDLHHLVEEPRIDLARLVNPFDRDATSKQLTHLKDAIRRGDRDHGGQGVVVDVGQFCLRRIAAKTEPTLLQRSQTLLQALGKCATDRHHFADRLHLRTEDSRRAGKLLERPARDLGDHVVDARLEARRGRAGSRRGDVVLDFVEGVTDGQLGSDLGDRKAGRLRCQRRRARHARIHLDDNLLAGLRVDRELHVAAAGLDSDPPDAREGRVAHLLVLDVAERLRRRNRDGVTGVHTHSVDVLDRADDDAVVGPIAHHLELVFLPPGNALLDQDLADRAGRQTLGCARFELRSRRGDPGAAPTEDVRRSDDDRQADPFDDRYRLFERVGDAADGDR